MPYLNNLGRRLSRNHNKVDTLRHLLKSRIRNIPNKMVIPIARNPSVVTEPKNELRTSMKG